MPGGQFFVVGKNGGGIFQLAKKTILPPPFVPSGTPYAWYSADSLSLSNNDPVNTWTDLSGNGHHLTTGLAPTFKTNIQNGLPAVYFSGDWLSTSWVGSLTQPNTMFIVCKLASTSDGILFDGVGTSERNMLQVEGGIFKLYAGGIFNGPSADTDSHIIFSRFNTTSSFIKIDGVYDPVAANAGSQVLNGVTLGGRLNGTGTFQTMHVMEFLIYDGAEASAVNDAGLAAKWGITI